MKNNIIHEYQEKLFDLFIYLSYFLIVLSFFKIAQFSPTYLFNLDYYVRIYICLFLIWRFNPFRTHYEFTSLDRKIAFSAGLFILTTTVLNKYFTDARNKLSNLIIGEENI